MRHHEVVRVTFTLTGFAYTCALVLAGVFLVGGASKLAWRQETRAAFVELGLPHPELVARVLPFVELALGVTLIALPVAGGAAALVMMAVFSTVLVRLLRRGVDAPCGCIGSPRDSAPLSRRSLLRNAGLAALAVMALFAVPTLPSAAEIAVTAVGVTVGSMAIANLRLPSRLSNRV